MKGTDAGHKGPGETPLMVGGQGREYLGCGGGAAPVPGCRGPTCGTLNRSTKREPYAALGRSPWAGGEGEPSQTTHGNFSACFMWLKIPQTQENYVNY